MAILKRIGILRDILHIHYACGLTGLTGSHALIYCVCAHSNIVTFSFGLLYRSNVVYGNKNKVKMQVSEQNVPRISQNNQPCFYVRFTVYFGW